MPLITDAAVRAAIRRIESGQATAATLTDQAPRGAGRLALIVKPGRAEWYAQRWVDGRRRLQKLGAWPAMTVADARARHAAMGRQLPARGGTLGDLFDGYLRTLQGRVSHTQARSLLAAAGAVIGRSRLARDVTPGDIVAAIRPVYARGAAVAADKTRCYLSAAFAWALRDAHDYRRTDAPQWGLTANPVHAVPKDTGASRPGERWLDAAELVKLLRWCASSDAASRRAIALAALTGQRPGEILRLKAGQWDAADGTLHWPTTKNGRPHTIPVCCQAAEILNGLQPSRSGWLIYAKGKDRPLCRSALGGAMREWGGGASARDLRRTWKTLAGAAGLSKADRDALQNHAAMDVSSRHYDRWDGMPEKRAAITRWEAWLSDQLRQHDADADAHQIVQGDEQDGGQRFLAHAPVTTMQARARNRTA